MRNGRDTIPNTTLSIEQVLGLLAEAPAHIGALTAGQAPARLQVDPGPNQWSANAVLAHLRACGDVWGGSIARIIAEDHPTLRAISPRTWIKRTDYPSLQFHASLQAFTSQREELLTALAALPPAGWLRSATVTVAGKTHERTVLSYAGGLASHEWLHVEQLEQVVKAMQV